jgi:hypothetical protein
MVFATAPTQSSSYTGALSIRSQSSSSKNRVTFLAGGSYRNTDVYLTPNTWYCMEMHVTVGATSGEAQVWVDGVLAADVQDINTGSSPVSWVRVGTDGANVASNYYYDDIVVEQGARVGCS